MFKKTLLMLALVGTFSFAVAADANAWVVVRRGGFMRRAVARTVLPPYPVTRRVVVGPVYRHPVFYGPSYYANPGVYARPSIYASPSVYIGRGVYIGY